MINLFSQPDLPEIAFQWQQLGLILLFYFVAWLIHRLAARIGRRLLRLNRFAPKSQQINPERQATLQGLFSGVTSFFVFTVATLLSLSLFVDAATLVWMVGLFSAAFGLGARPLVSDFLSGISFIFEDTFDVGEKVELSGLVGATLVEGVVEAVNLRTTLIRGTSGELYTVPNGEIRVVRNFSRGRFSVANIKLKVPSSDLNRAIPVLERLGKEAVVLLPNLLEPWQVISESGEMGQQTELTLVTKARFGNAAEMRPRLLTLVQDRLEKAEIHLVG